MGHRHHARRRRAQRVASRQRDGRLRLGAAAAGAGDVLLRDARGDRRGRAAGDARLRAHHGRRRPARRRHRPPPRLGHHRRRHRRVGRQHVALCVLGVPRRALWPRRRPLGARRRVGGTGRAAAVGADARCRSDDACAWRHARPGRRGGGAAPAARRQLLAARMRGRRAGPRGVRRAAPLRGRSHAAELRASARPRRRRRRAAVLLLPRRRRRLVGVRRQRERRRDGPLLSVRVGPAAARGAGGARGRRRRGEPRRGAAAGRNLLELRRRRQRRRARVGAGLLDRHRLRGDTTAHWRRRCRRRRGLCTAVGCAAAVLCVERRARR